MLSRIAPLIQSVGKDVTVKQITSTYNSSTRQSSETSTDVTVKAFLAADSVNRSITGIVPENTKLVYIAAQDLSFTPKPKRDKITVDSKSYTISACDVRHIKNSSALLVLTVVLDGN